MSAINIPYKVQKEIEIVLKYKGLEQTDPKYVRMLLDAYKRQYLEEEVIFIGMGRFKKPSCKKTYDLLTSVNPEFHRLNAKFPFENFKAHFIPVSDRPIIKIPFDGKINELADLMYCMGSRDGIIELLQNSKRKHIQSHFLINGEEIKNRSLSNALKGAEESAYHTWANNFIRRIQ